MFFRNLLSSKPINKNKLLDQNSEPENRLVTCMMSYVRFTDSVCPCVCTDLKLGYKMECMHTRSARIRALAGVPTPTAISFTPAESNLSFVSLRTEANSQLHGGIIRADS